MKILQKILIWLAMLSKRLYKKPTFVVILVLIPVLVLGYTAISGGQSGMLTIGLAWEAEDPITAQVVQELTEENALLAVQAIGDPGAAEELLRAGKLDAVWIFPGNMAEKIREFALQPVSSRAFIRVLEREDSVALMLSREKLNGAVYPYVAQRVYVQFLRELAPELEHLSDQELLEYYFATDLSHDLFTYEGAAGQQKGGGYLLSPLRGLLGTLILLCALATGMYYIRDMQTGTFAWVSLRWRFLPELGCQAVSSVHIGAVCLVCLALAGLAGDLWTELLVLPMYSLCCAAFAMALRRLCGSVKAMGALLPLMIVVVLVICPVFFDLGALRLLQYLLPVTYYINSIYNASYLGSMALYTLIGFGIYYLAGKCLRRG